MQTINGKRTHQYWVLLVQKDLQVLDPLRVPQVLWVQLPSEEKGEEEQQKQLVHLHWADC